MTAAGVGIYTLNNSHAAVQVLDPGETLIDASTVATMDGTTQVATITIHGAGHVDPDDVDKLASEPVVHDFRLPHIDEIPQVETVLVPSGGFWST